MIWVAFWPTSDPLIISTPLIWKKRHNGKDRGTKISGQLLQLLAYSYITEKSYQRTILPSYISLECFKQCTQGYLHVDLLKEVQIVYRLFLVNCYLLHVPRLPSRPVSSGRGWVIEKNWLELAWQYIAMTRNNLSIIWISLG